jgi:hypothetical protein
MARWVVQPSVSTTFKHTIINNCNDVFKNDTRQERDRHKDLRLKYDTAKQ